MCYPEWLPAMAQVNPWEYGEGRNTYEMLYQIFCRDIKSHHLKYNGQDVWFYKDIEDGKEKIFWHLTSKEDRSRQIPRRKQKFYDQQTIPKQRYPDMRRSERLPWVKTLIENPGKSEIVVWDYEEARGDIHTYIWLKDYDFVVIMQKRPNNSRRLITSFYVDTDYKRNDFERKYGNRIIQK